MSQAAATDDSACPPIAKAASMTIITRVLFTLLKQKGALTIWFQRELHLQRSIGPVSAGTIWFLI